MEEQKQKDSTIVIKNDVSERLKKTGHKGETYNEIIAKLLDSNGKEIDSHELIAQSQKPSESFNHRR